MEFKTDLPPRDPKSGGLRIVFVTDAAPPQVNGVVRTLGNLGDELARLGHEVVYITPAQFRTVPLPSYKEIRIAIFARRKVARLLDELDADAIHIATEGPLGLAARRYCLTNNRPFTTSFHTRFPEYLNARWGIPENWTYAFVRHFHKHAHAVMVATPKLREELRDRGFSNLRLWSRGVDTAQFHPQPALLQQAVEGRPRPYWTCVGRVAVEKNISAFLDLDLPGTKIVVGDGPQLDQLKKAYPEVIFKGSQEGAELATSYAEADCFVFPSKTDTFGLVMIEALACGTPVAAYPVQGPLDVIGDAPVGTLHEDLGTACREALKADRNTCRDYALTFSWEACSRQFLSNLSIVKEPILPATGQTALSDQSV